MSRGVRNEYVSNEILSQMLSKIMKLKDIEKKVRMLYIVYKFYSSWNTDFTLYDKAMSVYSVTRTLLMHLSSFDPHIPFSARYMPVISHFRDTIKTFQYAGVEIYPWLSRIFDTLNDGI